MKKFASLLLVASLSAIAFLAGCSSQPANEQPANTTNTAPTDTNAQPAGETAASGELPVIEFYHGYSQTDWSVAVEMRSIYDDFAKAHESEFVFKPIALNSAEDVYNKCLQEMAAGAFPDIVDTAGYNVVPAGAAQGLILDLKPELDKDATFKAGVGICYDQNQRDGEIYSVREQVEAVGFWYNEELFKKAGAKVPSEWQSLKDFEEAYKVLSDSPDVAVPAGMNQGWPTNLLLSQILLSTADGRDILAQEEPDFNSPAFKNAITTLTNSVLKLTPDEYFTSGGDADEKYIEDFVNGKAAMLFNGVWAASGFEDAPAGFENLKPAVFPADDGKKAALMTAGTGLVINAKMDEVKTKACLDFVKYMTGDEVASRLLKCAAGMVPSTSVDYKALQNDSSLSPSTKLLINACNLVGDSDYEGMTIGSAWDEDVASAIAGKFAGLRDGSKSVDQVADELTRAMQQ